VLRACGRDLVTPGKDHPVRPDVHGLTHPGHRGRPPAWPYLVAVRTPAARRAPTFSG